MRIEKIYCVDYIFKRFFYFCILFFHDTSKNCRIAKQDIEVNLYDVTIKEIISVEKAFFFGLHQRHRCLKLNADARLKILLTSQRRFSQQHDVDKTKGVGKELALGKDETDFPRSIFYLRKR